MKRKKNRAPALNIMTLKFFARHKFFPLKDLRWGIVKIHHSKGIELVCAVLVEGGLLYIDVAENKIELCVNISSKKFELIPCEVQKFEDKFLFISEEYSLTLMKKSIAEAYAKEVYSIDTFKYLLGAFAQS